MPLIHTDRFLPGDLEQWEREERTDALRWEIHRARLERAVARASDEIREFVSTREGYVGVSWGKDSVVAADLCLRAGIDWPLVHVKVAGLYNPDTDLVRDAFFEVWPDADYVEIEADQLHPGGSSLCADPQTNGFSLAAERYGRHYISGVRAEESGVRKLRMRTWGTSSKHTCAPAGWWSTEDVFAYLYGRGLPVHPAYAYSAGGTYPRAQLRTAAVGGHRGRQQGRMYIERLYYPELVALMERVLGPQDTWR